MLLLGYIGGGKRAMLLLKNAVLDKILLRRTKHTRSSDIMLPSRNVYIRRDRLDKFEDDIYQSLYNQVRISIRLFSSLLFVVT